MPCFTERPARCWYLSERSIDGRNDLTKRRETKGKKRNGLQAVQNGHPARPQGAGRLRRTLGVRRKEARDRERRWWPF